MMAKAAWLAWRVVTHDVGRLLTSLGGITFAAVLIIVQLGFRNGLLDSSLALLDGLKADVVVINREKLPFLGPAPLRRQRLMQAAAAPGVEAIYPLWFDVFFWRDPASGAQRPVRVVGTVPGSPVFISSAATEATRALVQPDTALIDRRDRLAPGEEYLLEGGASFSGTELVTIATLPCIRGTYTTAKDEKLRMTIAFSLLRPVFTSPYVRVEELRDGVWVETLRMELVEYTVSAG